MKLKPKYLKTAITIALSFIFCYGVARGFNIPNGESIKVAMNITLIVGIVAVNKFRKKKRKKYGIYI